MSAQQYEATLDLNYVINRQWEWEEMQWKIDHLEVEQICGQQVSCVSAQTVRMHEPLLQNLTAIGALTEDARRPVLAVQAQNSIYVPITELAEKRQAAVASNSSLLNPYMPLGTCVQTNMLPSEVQDIDVPTAAAMCKVHIQKFCASTRKWNRW